MVANFAVAAARLGDTVGLHGVVGDDSYGKLTLEDLSSSGVDVSHMMVRENGSTYFCIVMVDPSGEKALTIAATDCIFIDPDSLVSAAFADVDHVHTTGSRLDTLEAVVGLARQNGATLSVDLEPGHVEQRDLLEPLLESIDLVFLNRTTATRLTGLAGIGESATSLLRLVGGTVCVTAGGEGCFVASSEWVGHVRGFEVGVVDTTGCGDAFAAGFVHEFIRDRSVREAAIMGNAVGALNASSLGGHGGVPTLGDVRSLMSENADMLASVPTTAGPETANVTANWKGDVVDEG